MDQRADTKDIDCIRTKINFNKRIGIINDLQFGSNTIFKNST